MSTPSFLTLADQVTEHLRSEILRGRWSGALPGKHQLAAELGVNNKTVEGFTLDDCTPVSKGGFAESITWGEKKLDAVAGQELRLRFELKGAAIFTYSVE